LRFIFFSGKPIQRRALNDQEAPKGTGMIRKVIVAAALAAVSLTATACNTVKGVGEDVTSVGRAGERAIKR
jgi:predicted small secreted protein